MKNIERRWKCKEYDWAIQSLDGKNPFLGKEEFDWEEIFPIKWKHNNGAIYTSAFVRVDGIAHDISFNSLPDFILDNLTPIWDESELEEKPPLGLKPRWLHDEQRVKAIEDAIKRYSDAGKDIPSEWIKERDYLVSIHFGKTGEHGEKPLEEKPKEKSQFEITAFDKIYDEIIKFYSKYSKGFSFKKHPEFGLYLSFIKQLESEFEVTEKSDIMQQGEFGKEKPKFMACFIKIDELLAKIEKLEQENKKLKSDTPSYFNAEITQHFYNENQKLIEENHKLRLQELEFKNTIELKNCEIRTLLQRIQIYQQFDK